MMHVRRARAPRRSFFVCSLLVFMTSACGDVDTNVITRPDHGGTGGQAGSTDNTGGSGAPASGGMPGGRPDATTGGCRSNYDCAEPTPRCDPSSGACVECLGNEDCGSDDRHLCNEGRCVECVTYIHCNTGEICSPYGVCGAPCTPETAACPLDEPYCDPYQGICVECMQDGQCEYGDVCRLGGECTGDI